MSIKYHIAGYCRISVDEELDRDNTSIENQKAIIRDFVQRKFPGCPLDFYEDRDRSGYTFEQREGYQELREKMLRLEYDILIVKDFSRFSRRNSKGLVELEDLRDAGMRIISIGDSIDYPTYDDWTAIQFRFLINEMPVTDTSKKVKSVIKRRQEEGKWICAVPYGYLMQNTKTQKFVVDEPAAEIVREVFNLYVQGWGYQKIAHHLTDKHIPTPNMAEKMRRDANGEECHIKAKEAWSAVTISEMLSNDFYIGTLRQRKYRRKKINGEPEKLHETEHLVFENNHEAIVDYRVFAQAQEQLEKRSKSNYRGVKKYENVYSGCIYCGDCGAPMFAMSRSTLSPAYRCGTYHRQGVKGCTSHHTRVDMLDELLKDYIRKVRDNSATMLGRLQEAIDKAQTETKSSKTLIDTLQQQIEDARLEIKILTRQQARETMLHPEREEILDEIYTEQIDELTLRIEGLKNQLKMASDKHNTFIQASRIAKNAIEVFDNIIEKKSLSKSDIDFIVDKIVVYTDRIEIRLKPDIDSLLRCGIPTEAVSVAAGDTGNFYKGTEITENQPFIAEIQNKKGDIFRVNVVSDGDPLEIYTNSEGEVIFKKYSAISEMSENASNVAEVMYKTAGCPVVIFDKDHVVASAGVPKREFSERRVTAQLEELMENRGQFFCPDGRSNSFFPAEGVERTAIAAVPIITAGDVSGAVAFMTSEKSAEVSDLQKSLITAAAQFLAKQIE